MYGRRNLETVNFLREKEQSQNFELMLFVLHFFTNSTLSRFRQLKNIKGQRPVRDIVEGDRLILPLIEKKFRKEDA